MLSQEDIHRPVPISVFWLSMTARPTMNPNGKRHTNEAGATEEKKVPVFVVWLPPVLTAAAILTYVLTRHSPVLFWAFNLWDYLYPPLPQLLIGLMVVLSLPPVLQCAAGRAMKIGWRRAGPGRTGVRRFLKGGLVVACVFIMLWVLSERRMTGDWYFLAEDAKRGNPFIIKEAGGSFLFFVTMKCAGMFGLKFLTLLRFIVCVSGVVFFVFLYRLVCLVFESKPERLLAFAFLAVPGYSRLFFGHIEVYGFHLAALCVYFYFAVLYHKGKAGVFPPAFFLGVALWMHLSTAFLTPSLVYLVFQRETRANATGSRVWPLAKAAFFLMLPFAVFLVAMALAGYLPWMMKDLEKLLKFLYLREDPEIFPAVIPFFEPRVFNIDGRLLSQYPFFSMNHLLFLINAGFILSPAGLLTAVGLVFACIKKKGLSDPLLKFILTASLFMVTYSLIIYPLYWVYDWDLFSATAFCYTLLAVYLLFHCLDSRKTATYLAVYSISTTLLFNSLPFVLLSSTNKVRNAGLFSIEANPLGVMLSTAGNPDHM